MKKKEKGTLEKLYCMGYEDREYVEVIRTVDSLEFSPIFLLLILIGLLIQLGINQDFIFITIPNYFFSILKISLISTIVYVFLTFLASKIKSLFIDVAIIITSISYYLILLITYSSMILLIINKITSPIEKGFIGKLLIIGGTSFCSFLLSMFTTFIINTFFQGGNK